MRKRKKHSDHPYPKRRRESATKTNETRFWGAVRHATTGELVRGLALAFLLASIALATAVMTSTEVKTAAITFGLTGTLLVWLIVFGVFRYGPISGIRSDDIRFRVGTSFVGPGAVIFVRFAGPLGDSLSPAPLALSATLTNVRQVPVTLGSLSVEFRESDSGWIRFKNWTRLRYIPMNGNRAYAVGNDIKTAAPIDLTGNSLDQLVGGKPLLPNMPVEGWLFFEAPKSLKLLEHQTAIQWRFSAVDSAGNRYEATSKPMSNDPDDPDFNPSASSLLLKAPVEDLSKLPIRDFDAPQ